MKKIITMPFLIIVIVVVGFVVWFFTAQAPGQQVTWGVNFSQMQSEHLKMDWKKNYSALLDDLGVKHIKLLPQWDWIEGKQGEYYFKDVDWQVAQAEQHNASMVYVLGMKTGRWPECHIPAWANGLTKEQQQDAILQYIQAVVTRYKDSKAIVAWQAENEPLFTFGECPWYDEQFLIKEVALIKSLDPSRPVMVSDSGEQSLWTKAAQIGDVVGVTTYRKVWFKLAGGYGFYFTFPLPPISYWLKAQLVKALFHKEVIGVELQAEPWTAKSVYNESLQNQLASMDLNQFKDNVTYAQKTGIKEFYFWGAEWWYWLKEKQNHPEIWQEAKKVFQSQ